MSPTTPLRAGRRRALALLVAAAGTTLSRAPRVAARESPTPTARAIALRDEAVRLGDEPYGAVVVKDGAIVGEGVSAVVRRRDPAAHAEQLALADAAARLRTADLAGCVLYGSSRPCAACEDAAARAGIGRMYFGAEAADAGPPRRRAS